MPIDADLLDQAKAAEGWVIDTEHAAELSRCDSHRAVRRLQLAGASLREITNALGLSHQRIHQIVKAAGGSRHWRNRLVSVGEPRTDAVLTTGSSAVTSPLGALSPRRVRAGAAARLGADPVASTASRACPGRRSRTEPGSSARATAGQEPRFPRRATIRSCWPPCRRDLAVRAARCRPPRT